MIKIVITSCLLALLTACVLDHTNSASPALHSHGESEPHAHDVAPSHRVGTVSIREEDGRRIVIADGLPNHETGQFPNRSNPNRIAAQQYRFEMPINPERTGRITPARRMMSGVAVNGVPFDPGTAERWDPRTRRLRRGGLPTGWSYEAFGPIPLGIDASNAHVQPTGAYHYHGVPSGLVEHLGEGRVQIGWAADGFPIFYDPAMTASYRIRQGPRPAAGPPGNYDGGFTEDWHYVAGSGSLDECNGAELPDGGYGYFVTKGFPFIGRCFMGMPDRSFVKRRRPRPSSLKG